MAFTGAVLRGLELVDCVLEDCELSGTTLEAAILRRVRFDRCRMTGFTAPEIAATHVRFDDCTLAGAWLRMGRFDHCTFESSDLTESDLYGASLTASCVLRCTLDRAEVSGSSLRDVALHGTTIEGVTGVPGVQDVLIGPEQIVSFSVPVLRAAGFRVTDEPDDPA